MPTSAIGIGVLANSERHACAGELGDGRAIMYSTILPGDPAAITFDIIPLNPGRIAVFPNPFRDQVQIRTPVPLSKEMSSEIRGLDGRLIRVLTAYPIPSGANLTVWDGTDRRGDTVPAGG